MATVVTAIQSIASGQSQPLPPTGAAWNNFTQTEVFGFQIVFVYLIVIARCSGWLLEQRRPVRYISASAGTRTAPVCPACAWASGPGGHAGASGTFMRSRRRFYASLNGPSLTFGSSLLMPAFAPRFLGSTQLQPGRFNVWGHGGLAATSWPPGSRHAG